MNVAVHPVVLDLRKAGFTVAEGTKDVLNLIHAVSDDNMTPLCSGWRVFPDGKKCKGCDDCIPNPKDIDTKQPTPESHG